jgi:gliding motility-associated-like protein
MQGNISFYKMIKYLKFIFLPIVFISQGLYAQTADVTQGCVPLKVTFTAPSTSSTYFWDFKDGVTSDLQNPANIFNKPGIYNVSFQETVGGPVINTIKIEVFSDPTINIKVASGCYPLNAQLSNASIVDPQITIQKYLWVYGDGTSDEGPTVSSTTHLYTAKGDYNVSFGIETQYPSCNKTAIFNNAIHVYDPPVASFTTTPANTVSCNSTLTVGFNGTSTGSLPLSYAWDLGNGQTSTALNPPSQTYTTNTYTASLTVKFAANLAGCQSSSSKTISVGKPVAVIQKHSDTVCFASSSVFKTTSAGIIQWYADAGAFIAGTGTLDTVVVLFATPGFHTITLKVTSPNGQCFDQTTKTVYADNVQAAIQHTPEYSCSSPMTIQYKGSSNQSNVTYDWFFPDSTQSSVANVTKTFYSKTKGITYSINGEELLLTTLLVTSKKTGCFALSLALDTMWLPNARMMPNLSKGCTPLSVQFSDSSKSNDPIVKWTWIYGDGATQTNTSNAFVNHTYTKAGTYLSRLVVTTKKGCIDTSYAVQIDVGSTIANIDFTATKTSVCPGEAVTFNTVLPSGAPAIDGYHFYTEGNRAFQCPDQKDLTWSYKYLSGPQDVTLMVDYNGCFTTVKKTGYIDVKGTIASIDYNASCADPLKYNFVDKNSNASSLSWDFGDTQTGTSLNETHTYTSSGDYKVTLTATDASSGCPATRDSVIINARSLKAGLKIDTLLCINSSYTFDASKSVDVDAGCYKGYNWLIPTPNAGIRQSTSSSPTSLFTFTAAGTYVANLIVTDVNGCKDTATQKFRVFDIQPKFTADDILICTPGIVNFKDNSTGDTTLVAWKWSFGDGTTSNVENPSHTYTIKADPTTKQYKVLLKVSDKLGCSDSLNLYISQYDPVSQISVSNARLCLGQPVVFSASDYTAGGSSLKYQWDFGNSTTSTQQSQSVLYATDQTFNVNLNFQEIASGCTGSTSTAVNVQTYPTAAFTTNVDTVALLCAPKIVSFKDNSTSKYPFNGYWDFANGQTSTASSFTLVYGKGTYKVQHIVSTANGCADTTYKSYKVYSPEGSFVTDKNTICKGDTINFALRDTADIASYAWAFGDGIVVANQAPVNHRYDFHPPNGQTVAKLSLVGSEGCNSSKDTAIFIYQVIADFTRLDGVDSTICFNDGPYDLTNTSTGAANYNWSFGDGQTSTVQNINSHAYATPGIYTVSLAVSSSTVGCPDTISKQIVIYKNPTTQAIGDTVCQVVGSVALNVITPNPTSKYSWSPSTGLSSTTSTNPIATIQHTVQYTVVETDTNSCTNQANVPAVIIESIGLRNLDTSIVIGDIISLPVWGQSYYNFSWTPTKGLSCLTCNYPQVQPLEDILYTLNVTDRRGCYNENYTYKITIKPETFVKLPSMFTPNGDGNNDVVKVNGWGIKELREFQIFNRWGQLIYSSANINEGWDGTFNGALQSSDIYVYKVKALTWRDQEVKEEGYINLVR